MFVGHDRRQATVRIPTPVPTLVSQPFLRI
jgi:hypothetical protein